MKILIVDDNLAKVELVIQAITEIPGMSSDMIDVAANGLEARRLLQRVQFDLLILDVAIPDRADTSPRSDGGVLLLDEIAKRDIFKKPRHIVGLTAYPELAIEAAPAFESELWSVIHFGTDSQRWNDQLRRKIKHISLAAQASGGQPYGHDLAVVTALDAPEFSALMKLPWDWKPLDVARETANFHHGTFMQGSVRRSVVATTASDMGMVSATIASMRLLYNFQPRYLAMIGITAGIRGKCNIGDVLIADPCWDYGSGKILSVDGRSSLAAAPYQMRLPHALRGAISKLSNDQSAISRIQHSWAGRKPDTGLNRLIGPIGSGAAVRSDDNATSEIQMQHRKTIGLEMEAFGVLSAAFGSPLPEVRGFIMKSVSDFADSLKDDHYQEYAAYTSANALQLFAEGYLPFD